MVPKQFLAHNRPIHLAKKCIDSPTLTPASPSPPRDIVPQQPLTIPTERLDEDRPKIDVYSSAGESLINQRSYHRLTLSARVPDMSKPPISLEDLKTLEDDVQEKINERSLTTASLHELKDLRERIEEQIQLEDIKTKSPQKTKKEETVINTTVRNNLALTKKTIQPPDKSKEKEKVKEKIEPPKASPSTSKAKDTKAEVSSEATPPKKEFKGISITFKPKILKEPASIFGSILSNIDDQILEGKKKNERRSSLPGKDERRLSDGGKDHKTKSGDSKHSDKKKEERRSSSKEEKKPDEKKSPPDPKKVSGKGSVDKTKTPSRHEDTKSKDKSFSLSGKKTFEQEELTLKQKLEDADPNNAKDKDPKEQPAEPAPLIPEADATKDKAVTSRITVKKDLELKPKEPIVVDNKEESPSKTTIYKRLADKYNPKPRKQTVDADVDKAVFDSIEEKMKTSPPKIPVINQIPEPVPPPASLLICSQAEPEQPQPKLPAVLQNILNPSTTQLINTVVSHLRQTNAENEAAKKAPLLPTPPSILGAPPMIPTPVPPPLMNPMPQPLMNPAPIMGNSPLISPPPREDNFVSEYCREAFANNDCNEFGQMNSFGNAQFPNQARPDRLQFEPPQDRMPNQFDPRNASFIPPLLGDRFSENFGQNRFQNNRFPQQYNFNQNNGVDIQPLDYYPPNAPVPSNQYNCGPPLLSPEVPHYHNEQKPGGFGMMMNHDVYGGNEEAYWRTEEGRPNWERRDQDFRMNRDPRTYREYREMRESRDPRVARDNRDNNRESRDPRINREPRDRDYRDPRLNRGRDPRDRDERDKSRGRDSRSQSRDFRPSRYDSKFDRMYSRTNRERSRSRSRSRSYNTDTFASPLDSLYSGKEEHKTGKGYGVQNFRIPKIKKEDEGKDKEEEYAKVSSTNEDLEAGDNTGCDIEISDNDDEADKTEVVTVENDDDEEKTVEEEAEETVVEKVSADSPAAEEVGEQPKEDEQKESEGSKVTSSQPAEPEAKPADQTILAQFFANLLGSKNKRDKKTALYSLISTFSDSFSEKELSKITKIIKANDEDEEESSEDEEEIKKPQKPDEEKTKDETVEAEKEDAVAKPRPKSKRRIRRISSASPNKEEKNKEKEVAKTPEPEELENKDEDKEEESVIVTVGERIKSRKRSSITPPKPKKKCRTELDMLHEDIQDMFIRDGVLTASGKRMCRILKDDPSVLAAAPVQQPKSPAPEEVKVRKKPGPKPKVKMPNAADVKVMKSVRVVIPKMPDSSLTQKEETPKRNLRRSARNVAYAESDDDSPVHEETPTPADGDDSVIEEGSVREYESEAESSDNEKEKSQSGETSQKIKLKRKRGKSWASGVIPTNKRKKKKHSSTEPEELNKADADKPESDLDRSFVEPDRNYYSDSLTNKAQSCKLCEYYGRFITTHYKTVHPDSEVLTSRFSPTIAAEAIKDSENHLARYESIVRMRGGVKCHFRCRFCDFGTQVPPTLFYDHITTHTGEYRHICPMCEFSASSGKTLKVHMQAAHQNTNKRVARKSYGQNIIFGYMCGECNYVQLTQKNVEDHINIFHLQKPTVYKINMSTHLDPEIEKIGEEEAKIESNETASTVDGESSNKEESKQDESQPQKVVEKKVPPAQRKKPGPKPKKLKKTDSTDSNVTDTSSIASKESETTEAKQKEGKEAPAEKPSPVARRRLTREVVADEETLVTGRSKRAAKEKAAEKLKNLMEASEGSPRKKSLTPDEAKKPEEKKNEAKPAEETQPAPNEELKESTAPTEDKNAEAITEETKKEVKTQEQVKPEVKKEVELNVFTCKTDLQEENKKIEQERLQLMQELNKSVGSRSSLNFVDKLCNRLSQSNVVVKQEPQDDLTDSLFPRDTNNQSPLVMPVLEKEKNVTTPTSAAIPSPSTVTITQPKKPVLEPEVTQISKPSFDVIQKNDKIITDMIQKLKGKLDEATKSSTVCVEETDYDSEGPPPLTHVNELVNVKPADDSTKTLLIGGLVRVIKNSESLMFSCLVPPCVFSTENKDAFQAHCKEAHKQASLNRPSTLCEMCGIEIISSSECTLLENLFKHTITDHADFISKEPQEAFKPPGRVLRLRKLSGDALSIIRKDWDEDEDNSDTTENTPAPAGADKEENNKENQNVNNSTVSEVAVSEAPEEAPATMAELDMSEDNPFPFKIAGVMSLAEPQPPPLAPIAKASLQMTGGTTQLIVKEAKLTQAELSKPRKTQKAMAKFIASVSDLYKCPHYYCLFSTNFRDFLERHLKAHKVEHDVMIPCVYCDMKTPWEHVPMHIDIRHSHCRFACSYCLYRAVLREYVFLHQDQAHPSNDYSVIALPQPKHSKKFAIAEMKGDPKNLCEPFRCTKACNVEFLFENEFKRHLQEVHKSSFVPCGYKNCTNRVQAAKMSNHWSLTHGVSLYQCGYCRVGSGEMKKMYHHFAQFHPGLQPDILIRLLTPIQEGVTLGFGPEAFKQMRKVVNIVLPDPSKPEATTNPDPPMSVIVPTVQYGKPATFKTAPPFAKTIQVVTTLPQTIKKSVLIPSSKSGVNRTILVSTSSSTSGSNILLLPSSSGGTALSSGTTFTSATPLSGLLKTSQQPIVAPLTETVTTVPSVSTATVTTLPAASPTPDKESTAVEEQGGSQEGQLSIEPVEHITVGDDSQVGVDDSDNGDIDPLSLDADLTDAAKNADGFSSDDETGDESKVEKSKKTTKMGLLSYQLYRCAFCDISFSNSNDFKKHVTRSQSCKNDDGTGKPYVCVHCNKRLRSANVFAEHIQCHGVLRFSCSLCTYKCPTASQARSHMKTRHNINQTSLTPANATKTNLDTDEYVVRPKLVLQPLPPKEAPPSEPSTSAAATENVYTPDQIDKIPMRHILSSSIKCGLCSYTTKVRTNMVRHLQFHSEEKAVSDTAPVNPVPCLEKNEKMFDKMVNLASSSHAGSRMGGAKGESKEKEAENLPEFVLTHCRYVCPAQGCNYLCPEEANLRHHIIALHAAETPFTCVHCKRVLGPADADGLIKHFKLHGLQLYKCQHCSFVHNLKHKVERHLTDAHIGLPFKVITVRCLESEPKDQEPTTSQSAVAPAANRPNKPWRCCMCKYKSVTQQGIEQHVLEKHEIDVQFKCALCTYKSNDKDSFAEHFKEAHNGGTVDIIYAYRKLEEDKEKETSETFDTTPLWQRDRPRVRHIRGILFDDASPVVTKSAKKPAKGAAAVSPVVTPSKAGLSAAGPSGKSTNLDESIESVVNGTADILKDGPQAVSDDFIETVNKFATDSAEYIADDKAKDGDVIVIDDDEDMAPLAKNKDSKSSPAAKNRATKRKVAAEATAPSKVMKMSDEVIDLDSGGGDVDQDEFSERNLKLQFGGFGTPLNRQLKCPICNMFKSKKISDFIFHLFMEMKVYRFKCKICSDESITFRYMYKHVRDHNNGENCDDNIIFLPPNRRLEAWLQMVIHEQSVIMMKNFAPTPDPSANQTSCPQCGIK